MISSPARVLLDTCAVIFAMFEEERLSKARRFVTTGPVFFSSLCAYEIGIKIAVGKFQYDASPAQVEQAASQTGFSLLGFDAKDASIMATLPLHHKDPFDRMLIAQAMRHNLMVMTSDRIFKKYHIDVFLL